MALGWFSKKGSSGSKALQRAKKLAGQARWAEALTYYEEALDDDASSEEAVRGVRACREQLVAHNLEEAQAYSQASEPQKAREHADLAIQLAAAEEDLIHKAQRALEELEKAATTSSRPGFVPPHTASAGPRGEFAGGDEVQASDPGELFELYLESLSEEERGVIEPLGGGFREGFVLLQQGHTKEARPLLEAAAQQAPDSPGVPYALGLLAGLEGANEEADTWFSRALELSPRFGPAAHHRASILREAERGPEAAAFLERWLSAVPEDGEAWVILAACRADSGDPEGALAAAETAEKQIQAGDPRPALVKAQILRQRGDRGKALETLQGVVARRPEFLDALIPLGQILIENGGASAERAAEVFKHCYRLDPDRGWWYLVRVAEAYATRGWQAEAREVLDTARRELPDSSEAQAAWEEVNRQAAG
jgi:tetratricopeptide (TPR) repeat protein